ncbi:electron transport complex subunit RsxG [Alkalilimnicola ehrlichii MLHE-1]|uniref:Ion-translocating oxidoreductase complex subunit G n=1 Tax=Alkalilimnicola ehrlichii (strain ATCC BAA-1101 / DSM 17681 / MLHE-1) TaxID=187272 RepID=Q0AAH1_ALKEH|nr:electron transport complex subunit RsxG [Alkalilimnicola ehrlichii]ABI56166.1 electron transport complex, RnfABCDGE type, G subunit [Alkalilimnicola ehrlichii MLHE-1]
MTLRNILLAAGILGGFAAAGTTLVVVTHEMTAERIAAEREATLLRRLQEVLPERLYDNALHEDTVAVPGAALGRPGEALTVYRARRAGEPVAAILTVVAPDGYNGRIRLLMGVKRDGTLTGVRVVQHQETPGLGDLIEADRSDWVRDFEGRSLGDPPVERWTVRRDGGDFDQFTGATVTPRAVVHAVRRGLEWFEAHRGEVFPELEAAEEAVEVDDPPRD